MKFQGITGKRQAGISLVEALVYIACLSLLLSLLSIAAWKIHGYQTSAGGRADAVAKLLEAGEVWRNEMRIASSPAENAEHGIRFSQGAVEVSYGLADGQIVRTVAGKSEVLLKDVTSSEMRASERDGFRFWQWDVTIATGKRGGTVTFSFLAVPMKGSL
jgi:hypothetical protein